MRDQLAVLLMRRLWAWFYHRFHHPDQTRFFAWPWSRKPGEPWTYCSALGHKWGGWRREKSFYSRRCRRRRCAVKQIIAADHLAEDKAFYKGGKIWGVR